jgi:hypothetical protein
MYLPDSVWLILNKQEKKVSPAPLKSHAATGMKTATGARPAVPATERS